MRDGLFKSVDAGVSWKRVGNELKNVAAISINPKQTEEVFASTVDGAIYYERGRTDEVEKTTAKLTVKKESLCLVESGPKGTKIQKSFPELSEGA